MATIVTYFWRDETRDKRGYVIDNTEHVEIWRNMVRRNITGNHRLVCVSDRELNIEGVDSVPMRWDKHVPGTIYARLIQQNEKWARENLGDRILSLDLDIVIVDSIEPILARTEDYVIWKNPNYGPGSKSAYYQSSVQLFNAGARPELYDDFDPTNVEQIYWINRRFGGWEQAWISERLGFNEAVFTSGDGIYGAGRLDKVGVRTVLPHNARIISVPGKRAPWQEATQETHPWMKEHYR